LVPYELALAAVAWLAAGDIGTEALVPVEGSRVVDTSAAVLLLPLAVLALGAALTARVWWLLTRRRRSSRLPTRLPRRLALRRLQFGSKAGTAILGAGTLALGVSVFGLAMNSSLERTGVAKSAVYVGSDIRVLIAGSLPADVPGATEVWQRSEMEYAGVAVDLLAVDPASFAQAAFWDDAFADEPLAALLERLATGVGSPVPAILVGEAPSAGDVVNPKRPADEWPVEVVAQVHAFPGAGGKRPTLVVPLSAAQVGPINYFHFVFARGDYGEWRGVLQELGAQPMLSISRQDAVDSSVLQFAAWSFDFVKALGVFVGCLVVAALLLHLSARQRQQALGFAFLRRMGFSHRRHWAALVVEVGAMMLGVVVLGTALALACVRIVSPHVDPLPVLPPSPLMVVPWFALAVVWCVGLAVVFAGTAIAQVVGGRVDVAEVLRDGS
jgi:putative ABC transport system permease protein